MVSLIIYRNTFLIIRSLNYGYDNFQVMVFKKQNTRYNSKYLSFINFFHFTIKKATNIHCLVKKQI